MQTEKAAKQESPVAVYGAIIANLVIAASKFTAAFFSGSSAMLAEGIHSLVDTCNELFLLLGIHKSKKPADETHPFGHGMELYFWSFIVAVFLFGIGGGMSIYEGITHLLHPNKIEDPTLNYIVLAVAFISESISWIISYREFRKESQDKNLFSAIRASKNPTNYTVVMEDSAALAGLAVAFLGVYFGNKFNNPYFDGGASIIIGLILAAVSLFLARESKGLLLGESAGKQVVKRICEISEKDPAVKSVEGLLTMHFGPDHILLNMNVEFDKKVTLSDLPSVIDRLETKIRNEYPEIDQIFIEVGSIKNTEK